MKKLLTALLLLATLGLSAKGSYSDYYTNLPVKLKPVTEFPLPTLTKNLRDFGAKGDGVTLNTTYIQTAIDELSRLGGGRLIIPQGVWLTGPIEMKSNVNLHLERNAVLFFSLTRSFTSTPHPKPPAYSPASVRSAAPTSPSPAREQSTATVPNGDR